MTTLIPSNNNVRIGSPEASGPTVVPSPVVPVVIKAPPSPSVGLVVPVTGAPGRDGADGAPGDVDVPDLVDLATFFENGLF